MNDELLMDDTFIVMNKTSDGPPMDWITVGPAGMRFLFLCQCGKKIKVVLGDPCPHCGYNHVKTEVDQQ